MIRRFFLLGGTASALYFGIAWLLAVTAGVSYVVAANIAFVAAVAWNYLILRTAKALGGRANLRLVWPQPATGERFRVNHHQLTSSEAWLYLASVQLLARRLAKPAHKL